MIEVWKDIKDYEGLYQVSNLGRVRSLDRIKFNGRGYFTIKGGVKSLILKYNGYYQIKLYKNGVSKTIYVHRLVAEAFVPNPNNLPCVNHKDENTKNNCADNLEWCTVAYNNSYNGLHSRRGRNIKAA